MKKLYPIVALFLLSFSFYGQIVNIPDANFKAKLLAASPSNTIAYIGQTAVKIDTNDDGEIQVSEAQLITSLEIQNSAINSLEGIQAFTNLAGLYCANNTITSLDVSNLTQLTWLECQYNNLNTLVGFNPVLYWLDCSHNQIESLNLYTAVSLYELDCYNNLLHELVLPNALENPFTRASYNQLTSIDLSHIHFLQQLELDHNNISSISFNYPGLCLVGDTTYCDFSYNPLTQIDMSRLRNSSSASSGEEIRLTNTLLTEVTLPYAFFKRIYVHDNPELQLLNLRDFGDNFQGWGHDPTGLDYYFYNNPMLNTVCVNDGPYTDLQNQINNPNTVYTTYCSFTPGSIYNTFTGTIRLDTDGNGCNVSDAAATNISIKLVQSSQNVGNVYTNSNGTYIGYTDASSNTTLTPQFENPNFTFSPASYTTSFLDFGTTATFDFCLTPNGVHSDLEIALIPLTSARPGFDATYKIVYKNKGTTTQSGNVSLSFQDDRNDFVSATAAPSNIQTDQLTWNYTNLAPLESREITVIFNINSPVEIPAVNIGDILTYSAHVSSPNTDETDGDNYALLEQHILGSFDPNDKAVSLINYAYDATDKDYLYYTIRFQNTGTAAAENVVVADILDSILNENTLEIVETSHPSMVRYNAYSRKLEFIFEGINLPPTITDETGSHGYVTFKIKPVTTAVFIPGQSVANKASIYFDFNAPIETNTTTTYFYLLLQSATFNRDSAFIIYPNPVKNTLTINSKSAAVIQSIRIYNTLGQVLKNPSQTQTTIDVSEFKTGTYFIEINSDRGKSVKKFVKL